MRPPVFAPMLASTGRMPRAAKVVVEPKWDGVRSVVAVHTGSVSIRSRTGRDVTDCYPEVLQAPADVAECSAVFDGEIVALNDAGLPDFQRLQHRMNRRRPSAAVKAAVPVLYVVFDLLWHDDIDLTGRPLHERRQLLEGMEFGGSWQLTPRFKEPFSDELIGSLRDAGIEGVVVKSDSSRYRPGVRSPDWVKVKARHRHLAVIGGMLIEGARSRAGSLSVGMHTAQGFHYVGQVGNGLRRSEADQLSQFLHTIRCEPSPFVDLHSPKLRYVEPHVVVEVEYTEVTAIGTFRQPVLKRIVLDVSAQDVIAGGKFGEAIAARRRPVDVGSGQAL